MEHNEGTLQGVGGLELYYQCWHPRGEPRALLAIVHGFGEHSGRYINVVNHLVPCGYAVYGFDNRGHGRSPGQRGHINDWEEYRGDVRAFLQMIGREEPGGLVFLMGHSMGALIVLDYVLRHPEGLKGTIISGAGLEPVGVAKPYLVALARLLSRIWPRLSLTTSLDISAVSRDPAVVKALEEDPMKHKVGTARWGTESLSTIEWIKTHAAEMRIPLLVIHGGADRLASVNGSRAFFEKVTFPDKELLVYEACYHEPHNDINHKQVLADIENWLERHL